MYSNATILNISRSDTSRLERKLYDIVDNVDVIYEIPQGNIYSDFLIIISDCYDAIPIKNFSNSLIFFIGERRHKFTEEFVIYSSESINKAIDDIIDQISIVKRCRTSYECKNLVLKLIKQNNYLEKIANTDHLTGAYNKRYLMDNIDLLEYSMICMLDVDNFKSINDSIGHIAADHVLKMIVDIIFDELLSEEDLIRFGGDEFIIVSKCTEISLFIERMSLIFKKIYQFFIKQDIVITISYGVVESKKFNDKLDAIAAADQEMYQNRCFKERKLKKNI